MINTQSNYRFLSAMPAYGTALVFHARAHDLLPPGSHAVEAYFWNARAREISDIRFVCYDDGRHEPGAPAICRAVEHVNRLAFDASGAPRPCVEAPYLESVLPLDIENGTLTTFLRIGARAPDLLKHITQVSRIGVVQRCCAIATRMLDGVEEHTLSREPAVA